MYEYTNLLEIINLKPKKMIKKINRGRLSVKLCSTREELGVSAASDVVSYLKGLLEQKEEVNIIFASAPSQNDFLKNLISADLDWSRVNAFHMDEYIGIDPEAPQAFGKFLKDRLFSKVTMKSTNYINSMADDVEAECDRYAALLRAKPTDIVFLGIGENGHLAFNDPHVAFFDDPKIVKTVTLDSKCRTQQVNDGCFDSLDSVPTMAFTITIPELLHVDKLFAIVPAKSKAEAVKATCDGPISTECPSSILRTHKDVTLYIDADSGSLL